MPEAPIWPSLVRSGILGPRLGPKLSKSRNFGFSTWPAQTYQVATQLDKVKYNYLTFWQPRVVSSTNFRPNRPTWRFSRQFGRLWGNVFKWRNLKDPQKPLDPIPVPWPILRAQLLKIAKARPLPPQIWSLEGRRSKSTTARPKSPKLRKFAKIAIWTLTLICTPSAQNLDSASRVCRVFQKNRDRQSRDFDPSKILRIVKALALTWP